jgi:hypothetical protein
MPRFIIDIQKQHHTTKQTWGNRYIVECAAITNASDAASDLQTFEEEIHFNNIDFISRRISTQVEGDDVFIVVGPSGTGAQTLDGNEMPLFCTLDVVLNAFAGGRHGYKFYHTGFGTGTYDNDFTYDDGYLGIVTTAWTALFSALGDDDVTLVSPDGSKTYTSMTPVAEVKSHQFTKASKRSLPA